MVMNYKRIYGEVGELRNYPVFPTVTLTSRIFIALSVEKARRAKSNL